MSGRNWDTVTPGTANTVIITMENISSRLIPNPSTSPRSKKAKTIQTTKHTNCEYKINKDTWAILLNNSSLVLTLCLYSCALSHTKNPTISITSNSVMGGQTSVLEESIKSCTVIRQKIRSPSSTSFIKENQSSNDCDCIYSYEYLWSHL